MDTKQSDSEYSEQEARERGDAVLRHMMTKPPQKHEPLKKRKPSKPRTDPAKIKKISAK